MDPKGELAMEQPKQRVTVIVLAAMINEKSQDPDERIARVDVFLVGGGPIPSRTSIINAVNRNRGLKLSADGDTMHMTGKSDRVRDFRAIVIKAIEDAGYEVTNK